MTTTFSELSACLFSLIDSDPAEALRQAREIDLDAPGRANLMGLRAAILVDAGVVTRQQDAIEEGLELFRELHGIFPTVNVAYNLANGIVAAVGNPPRDASWLDHQERTRTSRAEARQLYWRVVHDTDAEPSLRTQAWTNLANQFSNSYRLGEAHDSWLAALEIDPENGVAAISAARNLRWLFELGICSGQAQTEAARLAKIAQSHSGVVARYAGAQAADQIAAFASELEDSPPRLPHTDPFIRWVEHERLMLAPSVEPVNPDMNTLDWLALPSILEREQDLGGMPPPIFAMFNILKSDFILARDLLWRVINEDAWPRTGRFASTLDCAVYGPDVSALILAHRTALDLLDKIAVAANHYFQLGEAPDKIYFSTLWRDKKPDRVAGEKPLSKAIESVIRDRVLALYGLVELADDYCSDVGILRPQKNLRNAGTHRFVVLHDIGSPDGGRPAPEVEHHCRDRFTEETLRALRVARSAIQMLVLAIAQYEHGLRNKIDSFIGVLAVSDHDDFMR